MIFRVYMKDPDVLHDGIDDALNEELSDMSEDEAEVIRVIRHEKAADIASTWFEYGEYLTVEIDTENQTIRVVPVGEG
jgi:hypothetical protein